ncbi:MAG TPA: ribosome recycling factor [Alphaproteobacteria bacterium]|nr:ribosome recycling factor [Alphaproteobacteria bacterium]
MAALLDDLKRRMDASLDTFRKELGGLRTGRASVSMLDPVQVEAYGNRMPLNQVGTVNVPEARLLTVQVWDAGMVKAVEKAITEAGLGLNPQAEGNLIRLPIPPLTQERRQELSKVASKYAEGARVAIRNVRRDGMEQAKKQLKDKQIGEDEEKNLEQKIQQLTDSEIKKIDEALANKEKEITQV